MATTKSRINISLPDDTRRALDSIAKRDQMPAATKAANLLEIALELEEDQVWGKVAKQRDTKGARFVSHEDAFNI